MSQLLKGQIWYMDFILGLTLFIIILIVSFKYMSSSVVLQNEEDLTYEADRLSGALMRPGIPINWTPSTVLSIGLVDEQVLDPAKVAYFANLSNEDYGNTKVLLGVQPDYLVYFMKGSTYINVTNQTFIGMGNISYINETASEIITLTRYVVYSHDNISEIIGMKVMVWDE